MKYRLGDYVLVDYAGDKSVMLPAIVQGPAWMLGYYHLAFDDHLGIIIQDVYEDYIYLDYQKIFISKYL